MQFCGVCSVSFRNHSPEEIIDAVAEAGLDGIEWGSDVHVAPGDIENAKRITALMKEKGLKNLSYGTYFGVDQLEFEKFEDHLKTADALETDILRIWPPSKRINEFYAGGYGTCVRFMKRIAKKAAEYGKTVCFEKHHGTLTESTEETLRFLGDINKDNVKMYWQPNHYENFNANLCSVRELSHYVENVHVFNWRGEERLPLKEAVVDWREYYSVLDSESGDSRRSYLLEFMPDDKLTSLKASAEALRKIVNV